MPFDSATGVVVPMFRSLARRQPIADQALDFSGGGDSLDMGSLEAWLGAVSTNETAPTGW